MLRSPRRWYRQCARQCSPDTPALLARLGTVERSAAGANHLARLAEGGDAPEACAEPRPPPRAPPPRSQWSVLPPPPAPLLLSPEWAGHRAARRAPQRHLAVTPRAAGAGAFRFSPSVARPLGAGAPRAFPWLLKTWSDPGDSASDLGGSKSPALPRPRLWNLAGHMDIGRSLAALLGGCWKPTLLYSRTTRGWLPTFTGRQPHMRRVQGVSQSGSNTPFQSQPVTSLTLPPHSPLPPQRS